MPGDSASGTSTSSSGCHTKHLAFAAAPEPAEVGTDTSGSVSPAGVLGPLLLLLLPSPKSNPPGLVKKCLDPPLEGKKKKKKEQASIGPSAASGIYCGKSMGFWRVAHDPHVRSMGLILPAVVGLHVFVLPPVHACQNLDNFDVTRSWTSC